MVVKGIMKRLKELLQYTHQIEGKLPEDWLPPRDWGLAADVCGMLEAVIRSRDMTIDGAMSRIGEAVGMTHQMVERFREALSGG